MNAQISVPAFSGNINFNAQHSPMGAFMSFTCGHFGSGGGIGVEIGRPANQNIYIGVKKGLRRAVGPIKCLPFVRGIAQMKAPAEAHYSVEHAPAAAPTGDIIVYDAKDVRRHFGWATDSWATDDLSFSVYTPFGPIPKPGIDEDSAARASLLPAVVATMHVDNRNGTEPKTAVFALDFPEAGTRVLRDADPAAAGGTAASTSNRLGFAWRRSVGVLGTLEDGATGKPADGLYAIQRWSVAEGVSDVNPIHELGSCGGIAFEVPAGQSRTLLLALGAYLDGDATTGLEGRYFYTRHYASLEQVLTCALERASELRTRAALLDKKLLSSALSPDQQFQIAHGTRGYYGSTQLLDIGGEPFWIVNEGEYCMMNTLDLAIDHAFWELQNNPWVVENLLNNFARHYSYHDQVKTRGGELLPGGLSFCHDMGVNNNFSRTGHSSYELANLTGCFSYMTQEQLANWVLLASCYVAYTNDAVWVRDNAHLIRAAADSLRNRANLRTGVMTYDSARCGPGQEITTYDSLDESLGQARANSYLAAKCWASWVGLEMLSRLSESSGGEALISSEGNLADAISRYLVASVGADGVLPAVIEKGSAGYAARILPVVEALIYPAYWLESIETRGDVDAISGIREFLAATLRDPLVPALKKHTIALLTDPQRRNLFADGGIKLSSTSNNSWMSKIALFQHVARSVMKLHESEPGIAKVFEDADAAHVRWQTDGSGYWACSDQFVSGVAKGSRYYPRIITAALWLDEQSRRDSVEVSIHSAAAMSRSRKAVSSPKR